MARLAGVGNTREASPKSLLRQHQVQVCERVHGCSRIAQLHVSASHGVEHPASDHDHDAWSNLDVDYFAVGALLAVFAPDAPPIQRVPTIEDFNFSPDMGRMTR